jgi:hypothetical protein
MYNVRHLSHYMRHEAEAQEASMNRLLRFAASQFEILAAPDAESDSRTHAKAVHVAGPLKSTMMLFEDSGVRVCLVTTHFGWTTPVNVCELYRNAIAAELRLPASHVLICSSHNHCCAAFASNAVQAYAAYGQVVPPAELLPIGHEFLSALIDHSRRLPDKLQPVSVWWAEGNEGRITYNRKGHYPDGTSYFIREQDRRLLGADYQGDIDTQAPIVTFRNTRNETVGALTQFTGHPVTAYHPEKPIIFGEWPQVACDIVAEQFDSTSTVPVGFLQGCAGNVNSKEMLFGDVARSTEFGQMLGQSYVDAMANLRPSERLGMHFAVDEVQVPLAPLPSVEVLVAELAEMDNFIQRAHKGDENTRSCVGQNFPKELSPKFRADLVQILRRWNHWALEVHREGKYDSVPQHIAMEVSVLRLGDIGIVGLPCEPFQNIGRQIRRSSRMPLNIPCGYTNISHGYITDRDNTGDQEYMSAHYRYTRFRPPLMKPAGDVLAQKAVELLNQFEKESRYRIE